MFFAPTNIPQIAGSPVVSLTRIYGSGKYETLDVPYLRPRLYGNLSAHKIDLDKAFTPSNERSRSSLLNFDHNKSAKQLTKISTVHQYNRDLILRSQNLLKKYETCAYC